MGKTVIFQGSRGGMAAFSGRGVAQQFAQLAAQQETLQSLAADTGGTFTDVAAFDEVNHRLLLGKKGWKEGEDYQIAEVRFAAQLAASGAEATVTQFEGGSGMYNHLTRLSKAQLEAQGVHFADAPVARTREAALRGDLSITVGATDESVWMEGPVRRVFSGVG